MHICINAVCYKLSPCSYWRLSKLIITCVSYDVLQNYHVCLLVFRF